MTGYVDNANEKKILTRARQYQMAAQSVYNDAYGNDFRFSTIFFPATTETGIAIDINNSQSNDTVTYYENMFKDLAEIVGGDIGGFVFNNNNKLSSAYIEVDEYKAVYDGEKWQIKD